MTAILGVPCEAAGRRRRSGIRSGLVLARRGTLVLVDTNGYGTVSRG